MRKVLIGLAILVLPAIVNAAPKRIVSYVDTDYFTTRLKDSIPPSPLKKQTAIRSIGHHVFPFLIPEKIYAFRDPAVGWTYPAIPAQNQNFPGGGTTSSISASTTKVIYAADPTYAGGVKGGAIIVCDAAWGGSSHTATISNTTGFTDTPPQIGWTIFGTNSNCAGGAYNSTQVPLGTVTNVVGNTITYSTTSGTACTSNAGSAICTLVYGPFDDTAAWQAAWTANIGSCGLLVAPVITSLVSSAIKGPSTSQCGLVNTSNFVQLGVGVTGQGSNNTIIIPLPNFNGSACDANNGCFFTNPATGSTNNNMYFTGFEIYGGGQYTGVTNFTNQFALVLAPDSVATDVGVNQWGIGFGFAVQGSNGAPARCNQCFDFGGGAQALMRMGQSSYCDHCVLWGANSQVLLFNGNGATLGKAITNHTMIGTAGTQSAASMVKVNATAFWQSKDDYFSNTQQAGEDFIECAGDCEIDGATITAANAGTSVGIEVDAGGRATYDNSYIIVSQGGTGTGVKVDATGVLTDLGGNKDAGSVTPFNIAGTFIPDLKTTYPASMSKVGVSGTGACATSTITGNIFAGSVTCTAATGASTLTLTPGITATNGWNCRNSQDVTTPANTFTQNTIATGNCVLTFAAVTQNDVIMFNAVQF